MADDDDDFDHSCSIGTVGPAFQTFLAGMKDEMQDCVLNCILCRQTCERMIAHCLKEGGKLADLSHINILTDCADICSVASQFMLRESVFHVRTCEVCAEVCAACADDCDLFHHDEVMRLSCEVCRRCAESCRKLVAASK